MFSSQINQKYKITKTPMQSPKNKEIDIKKETMQLEEEINTKKIKEDEKEISDDDDIKIKKEKEKKKTIYNLSNDEEEELSRIELKKNIVVRLLNINDEKFIDFCKFYKGYPTKKNIRIKYKTYIKLNELLNI